MNIVLIGYRGTGKSVVGKIVSGRLQMKCIAMDARIVEEAGMSIPEIVENHGWTRFRDMESKIAREFANFNNIIIDAGGGVIERSENIDILRVNSCIIWLKASSDTIISRIQGGTERPSLTGENNFTEEVKEVLKRRTPKYARAAQYEIETDQLTPEQVADQIAKIWKKGDCKRHSGKKE